MNWDLRRTARYYYLRFKRLQGSPVSLAMGAAIGAAVAITPTLPLHTIIIVCLTLLLRVSTVAAIIAGTIVSNPLTFVPQYYLAWKIGDFFLPGRMNWERIQQVLEQLRGQGLLDSLHTLSHLSIDAVLVMMTGGLILAIPTGLFTYFFSYWFFTNLRLKRQQKHLLNHRSR